MVRHRTLVIASMALVATAIAFVLLATAVAADPLDVANPPEEDWVFDSGGRTVIRSVDWDVGYNITVTNGSSLRLERCTLSFDSLTGGAPVWLLLEEGSLEIDQCTITVPGTAPGFHIEAHDRITIAASTLEGLTGDPSQGAAVAVYDADVDISFTSLTDTRGAHGIHCRNGNLSLYNCTLARIDGDCARMQLTDNEPGVDYWFNVTESQLLQAEGDGIVILAYSNYGNARLDCFKVRIEDVGANGVTIDVGDHTPDERGNGSLLADLVEVTIDGAGDRGMYLSSTYLRQGAPGQNQFNVTLIDSRICNTTNTGIYTQMFLSVAHFNLVLEGTTMEDVAIEPETGRLSGVFFWFYRSTGQGRFYAGNTTFRRCNPAGFESWDFGDVDLIHFYNCTFDDNAQGAIYAKLESNSVQAPTLVEGCTITGGGGYGIHTYASGSSNGRPIDVVDTLFTGIRGPALLMTGSTSNRAAGCGFNLTSTVIEAIDGPAVDMNQPALGGGLLLTMRGCRVSDTDGIRMVVDRDYGNPGLVQVLLEDTIVEDSDLDAIKVVANGYTSLSATVVLENVTVLRAGGDGLSVTTGTYRTSKPALDCVVLVLNSTLDDNRGNGASLLLADLALKGTRTFDLNGTAISTAQRGLFLVGFSGTLYGCTLRDMLKEEVVAMACQVDVRRSQLTAIEQRTCRADMGGVINFHFDLDILVAWDTGAPAVGATVEIMDNTQKLIAVVRVESDDGSLPTYHMRPYVVMETGIFSTSPYVIEVTFLEISRREGVRLDRDSSVLIVLEDHAQPQVHITTPKDGHVQQSMELEVRGTAWDGQSGISSLLLSLDGVTWEEVVGAGLSWNHTLTVPMELIRDYSGMFSVRAKAVDGATNERVTMVLVRIDPTPPELRVDHPADGMVTNRPVIPVTGVTEMGSSVKVNGVPVELVVSMFSIDVRLVEGPNTITVVSIDPLGNIEIVTVKVHLDTREPFLALVRPAQAEETNTSQLTLEAQLEDGLSVTVNGVPVVHGTEHYPVGEGTLSFPVTLAPGPNIIVVTATDAAGNSVTLERVVTLDREPPWVALTSPRAGDVLAASEIVVEGTAEPGARLFIMDEEVTISHGHFRLTILGLEGANDVTVLAMDGAGNSATETVRVHVDTRDPVVTVVGPPEGTSTVTSPRIDIVGTVVLGTDEGPEGHRLFLNGLDHSVLRSEDGTTRRVTLSLGQDGSFSIPVDLVEGRNVLTVTVTDGVGNTVSVTRTVVLDSAPPTLVVHVDPAEAEEGGGLLTRSPIVTVSGYTEPGAQLTVLDIPVTVGPDGRFSMTLDLAPDATLDVIVVATDAAGNARSVEHRVTHTTAPADVGGDEAGDEDDLIFLLAGAVAFAAMATAIGLLVRSQRGRLRELEEVD